MFIAKALYHSFHSIMVFDTLSIVKVVLYTHTEAKPHPYLIAGWRYTG